MHIYQQLMTDHRNLARVLKVLEREIGRIGREEDANEASPDMQLIEDILDYVHYYPDAFHHPLEDAAFDYLIEHDICSSEDVADIRQEHKIQERQTTDLRQMIQSIEADQPVPASKLHGTLSEYLALQYAHIRKEEERIFGLIKALDDNASDQVASRVEQRTDPLFAKNSRQQFTELLRSLNED